MDINLTNRLRALAEGGFCIGGILLVLAGAVAGIARAMAGWAPVGCVALGGMMLLASFQAPRWISQSILRSYDKTRHGAGFKRLRGGRDRPLRM